MSGKSIMFGTVGSATAVSKPSSKPRRRKMPRQATKFSRREWSGRMFREQRKSLHSICGEKPTKVQAGGVTSDANGCVQPEASVSVISRVGCLTVLRRSSRWVGQRAQRGRYTVRCDGPMPMRMGSQNFPISHFKGKINHLVGES